MIFSIKLHNEHRDHTLTYSVQLFLDPHISPGFHCIVCHQRLFRLLLWPSYRPNQSGNIQCGTHIPLLWHFWIITAVVQCHIRFSVWHPVVFAVVWIIQVPIPVKPIFVVWNTFRWTILITFGRMAVESCHFADIQNLSSSSRGVLCRQSW